MKSPSSPVGKSVLSLLICLGLVAFYINRVARVYLAQEFAQAFTVKGSERAIQLIPGNAAYWHQLGIQLSAADEDDEVAIANLSKAATLNPNSARYWLDLASVYQATDKPQKQEEAVEAALHAEPGNPEVAAEVAQFFLVEGNLTRALPLFRQALARNPDAAKPVLLACWRQTQNPNLILAQVIPDSPELQLEFLRLLTQEKQSAPAQQVWQYMVASGKKFEPQLSFFYFDYLLNQHDTSAFDRGWRGLASFLPNLLPYLPNDNLIVNSSFELPRLNAGFDWRYITADHIAAGFDNQVSHSGSNSLALLFDGNSSSDAGWTQFVPVEPNTDYEFSAWIKSEGIISASGPRIAIADAYSGTNLLLTDDVLDTHPWQELKATLRVPITTNLVKVGIVRSPADTRIRGRFWIDDLRLAKKQD